MSQHPDSLHSKSSERRTLGMGQATKPFSQSHRRWSRVCHEIRLFLRSIGLGIVVTTFQGFFTKNFSEPEKVAIRQSRTTALLKLLIHALPLGMAIFEIVINCKSRYVGAHFDKQNYLQFVAKAHEILMQASLATIILSYIRYHISAGKGMPFGALLGALQFLQVSYLWSLEFWSAITSKEFQLKKKICFAILILICMAVAATAGPSSANLLIARQRIWPMESAYISLNATFQDIWPDRLDDQKISSDCKIVRLTSDSDQTSCPLSTLYGYFESGPQTEIVSDPSNFESLEVQSPETDYVWELMMGTCFQTSLNQPCTTIPHQPFLAGLIDDFRAQHEKENFGVALNGYHMIRDNYYQPYTTASCVTDVVRNGSDQDPLQFPRILETNTTIKDREIVSVSNLTKSHSIDKIPGNSSQFRVGWVDLPQDIFNTGVPGAIIVHPQSSKDSSYNITTCAMNAGWGSSTILTDSSAPKIRSHMSQTPPSWPVSSFALDAYGYLFTSPPNFGNISSFSYPQRRISISKTWMEFINPTLVLFDNTTTNPVSLQFSQLPSQPTEYEMAWTLSVLLSNALSSTGREYDGKVFEDLAKDSASCEACLVLEIKNYIFGWSYTADGTTTKLSLVVMFTYCILVLAHIIYSAISGVSSTAWDSVAELVALAMNSSPTEILENTCAGIVGRKVYQAHVRVLKTSEKHLELVFGEIKDPNADVSELVMNEEYGSLLGGMYDADERLNMAEQGEMRKKG